MASRRMVTMDGNEAAASVAHRINEVIAIYPITPSSNMGEWADEWSAKGRKNIWGTVPSVSEMQSEGGAAGAVHGALQAGALTTTFTASQGLLLMIPNMYKIAGELTAFCMHVSARTVATHALSIFGDHSDVMAVRQTGFGLLSSASVQEAHDFAVIAQRASLLSRVPFLHFFDGFRTSHEVAKIEELTDDDLRQMIPEELVAAHRAPRAHARTGRCCAAPRRTPTPSSRRARPCNPFYAAAAEHVAGVDGPASRSSPAASYRLFEYVGHPEAERVIVAMGSGVRDDAGDRRAPRREGREGRPREGPALPAVRPRRVHDRLPADRAPHRGARPHEGAGRRSASRSTRTWSRRSARRSRRTSTASTTSSPSSAAATASPPRSSRRRW